MKPTAAYGLEDAPGSKAPFPLSSQGGEALEGDLLSRTNNFLFVVYVIQDNSTTCGLNVCGPPRFIC